MEIRRKHHFKFQKVTIYEKILKPDDTSEMKGEKKKKKWKEKGLKHWLCTTCFPHPSNSVPDQSGRDLQRWHLDCHTEPHLTTSHWLSLIELAEMGMEHV